jgi:dTDP-4-amino-4,6-dideoxygalactose transaminase
MDNREFLPFALPDIDEEEIQEVVDTLRSGWITTGPKTKQFEQDFSSYIGGNVNAIAVNSATAGLHLTLEAIGINPGDEVITTPYTFTATAEVIRYLGAHPIFVDIDPLSFNIDSKNIEKAVTPKTKAIIPVHFGGLACEMDEIIKIARHYDLKIIEDAAHALPATSNGKKIGGLDTDATIFSFYATKTITTGEGGMIVTKNPAIAERCRIMRLHGISRDVFDRYNSIKPSWQYDVIAPGYKYNLTDIAAAIGIHQLKKTARFQTRRKLIAERYNVSFAELPVILPPNTNDSELHAWHLYVIRLTEKAGISRDEFIKQMAERGIGCSVHFIPLHILTYWKEKYNLKQMDYPNAYNAYLNAVSLPIYTKMTDEDVARVITAVTELLG